MNLHTTYPDLVRRAAAIALVGVLPAGPALADPTTPYEACMFGAPTTADSHQVWAETCAARGTLRVSG